MQSAISRRFVTGRRLKPVELGGSVDIVIRPINLAVSGPVKAGTPLGQFSAAANSVHTLSANGTVSGGTYKLVFTHPFTLETFTSDALDYNATVSDIQDVIDEFAGVGNITVGGGAFPANPVTFTAAGLFKNRPIPDMAVIDSVSGGGSVGITQTTKGRWAGAFGLYANGNADGTETGQCLLADDIEVDESGLVSYGDANQDGAPGRMVAYGYFHGAFDLEPLIALGVDSGFIGDVGGRVEKGSFAGGKGILTF